MLSVLRSRWDRSSGLHLLLGGLCVPAITLEGDRNPWFQDTDPSLILYSMAMCIDRPCLSYVIEAKVPMEYFSQKA
jgi:hypothetical protein